MKKLFLGNSIVSSVVLGLLVAVVINLVGALIGAVLISGEHIKESSYQIVSLISNFTSVLVGSIAGMKKAGKNLLIVAASTAGVFILMNLAMTVMFFEGNFNQLGAGLAAVLGGFGLASFICLRQTGRKRKNNVKLRR